LFSCFYSWHFGNEKDYGNLLFCNLKYKVWKKNTPVSKAWGFLELTIPITQGIPISESQEKNH